MKKVLIGLVAVVVGIVAALLIAPSFIDWNQYKGEITAQAKAFTGRDLAIDGDLKATILPAPAVVVEGLRLANADGAGAADMVQLKSVEVRVALGPLLGGRVQVESVTLVDPVIEIEKLAGGRWNFELATEPDAAPVPSAPEAAAESGTAESPVALQLDRLLIENGVFVYRDAAAGVEERIDDLDARFAVASLEGPFEAEGTLTARGIPLRFDIAVGKTIEWRTMPFKTAISTERGASRIEVGGTLSGLADEPRFNGKFEVEADNLAGLIQAVAKGPMPGIVGQAFSMKGAVSASTTAAETEEFELQFGDATGTARASATYGDEVSASVEIALNRIDVDSWLALAPVGTGDAPPAQSDGSTPAAASGPAPHGGAFEIPSDIAVSVGVTVEAATFRGGVIRQARATADLAAGEITISQIAAQLPGGSEFAVFGFVTAADGAPRFDGEIEASVSDLRSVLQWLQVEVPEVRADRLRKLALKAKLAGTPEAMQVRDVDLQLDSSRATGGVTIAATERLSFGADVTVDQINLDAYLPKSDTPAEGNDTAQASADAAQEGGPSNEPGDPFAALAALGSFDANVKARVKAATYSGVPIKELVIDATIFDGALDIRRASVGDVAGASANVAGKLKGFGSVPSAEALTATFKAADPSRLFELAATAPPPQLANIGAVSGTVRLDGAILGPNVDAAVKAAGGDIGAKGAVKLLPAPAFDGRARIRQPDLNRLLRTLAIGYRPSGNIGAIDIQANVVGDASAVSLTDIEGNLGNVSVAGAAAVTLAGERPKIAADLVTGALIVDPFLPAEQTAGLSPYVTPVAWRVPVQPERVPSALLRRVAVSQRWSREPVDLSALQALDATVKLRSDAVTYQAYTVENADIQANLSGGVLTAERVAGALFGGPLIAAARVDATAVPRISANVKLDGADVRRATIAAAGEPMASGRMALNTEITTVGGSVADWVSSLNGTGSVALTQVDVAAAARGSALAPLLGLFQGLGQLGSVLAGGTSSKRADITGSYQITNGVARSNDLRLAYYLGNGAAAGTVDLPAWQLDVAGEVKLAQNVLTGLLGRATGGGVPDTVPFQIRGPLDAPNVNIDTKGLASGGLPIPGLDKLGEKTGLGGVLNKLIPGTGGSGGTSPSSQPQTAPAPGTQLPPPPSTQQQQQKTLTPQDLLKGLFKR